MLYMSVGVGSENIYILCENEFCVNGRVDYLGNNFNQFVDFGP